MTQIQKVILELQQIQFCMMVISDMTAGFHASKSQSEIVKKLQDETRNLFNEYTLKIREMKNELINILDNMDSLQEEDINYLETVDELIKL